MATTPDRRSSAVLDLESWRLEHGSVAPDVMRPVLTPGGTLALVIDGSDPPRLFRADGAPLPGGACFRERTVVSKPREP